jgi:hypothetical protein
MIDDKNAKQIVNEPSSFFVSTISKESKFKPTSKKSSDEEKKSLDKDEHLTENGSIYDTDPLIFDDPSYH